MPNENVLAGIRCPICKQEDEFRIDALVTCKVTDEGAEADGDFQWNNDNWIVCAKCEHEATVGEFRLYRVFNTTDEIWASPGEMSLPEAHKFCDEFRSRFKQQGYYLTAKGERIDPMTDLILHVEEV